MALFYLDVSQSSNSIKENINKKYNKETVSPIGPDRCFMNLKNIGCFAIFYDLEMAFLFVIEL